MIQMGGHFASRRQEQQRLGRLLRWGKVKRRFWETSEARARRAQRAQNTRSGSWVFRDGFPGLYKNQVLKPPPTEGCLSFR